MVYRQGAFSEGMYNGIRVPENNTGALMKVICVKIMIFIRQNYSLKRKLRFPDSVLSCRLTFCTGHFKPGITVNTWPNITICYLLFKIYDILNLRIGIKVQSFAQYKQLTAKKWRSLHTNELMHCHVPPA